MGIGFQPTVYVDISATFELKRQALQCHRSQRPGRFVAMAETWSRFRARQCNADATGYAECFRLEPVFPFADIRALLPPLPPIRPLGQHASGRSD